jgi:hypothetical protein
MKDVSALCLLVQRFLDSRDLSLNAVDTVRNLFFSSVVCAIRILRKIEKRLYRYTPVGIFWGWARRLLRPEKFHQKGGPFDV